MIAIVIMMVIQTNSIKLPKIPQKPAILEKITLNKLDPKDLANIIKILELSQFNRYKR